MKSGAFSVGSFEAKNRFSELLDRVRKGAEVTITKHDKPVAKMVPATTAGTRDRKQAVAELRAMRTGYRLGGIKARQLIEHGRR